MQRTLTGFLADDDGAVSVVDALKIASIAVVAMPIVFAADSCSGLSDQSCSCAPPCDGSCHANTLIPENQDTELCGFHCHRIIQGGECDDDDGCGGIIGAIVGIAIALMI